METLKMENVGLIYQTDEGETEALKDINFSVKDGEFVSVIGPSGCGKTTVLSLISGLLKPTSGCIFIDGKKACCAGAATKRSFKQKITGVFHKPPREKKDVGYMLQRDQLFEWRNIESNIMLGLEIQKIKTPENTQYALDMLEKYGLKDFNKHLPAQLSGGMRQRAALIRTLAFKPKLLLLDEPFSALDYQTRLSVCDDVHAIIKAENKTAVLVTHDLSEAISLSDRIIVLSARPGQIKSIYTIDLKGKPLQRREDPKFPKWFDMIWKDVSL